MCYDTQELVKRIMEKEIREKRRKLILKAVTSGNSGEKKGGKKERECGRRVKKENNVKKIASQFFKTFRGI